VRDPKRRLLAAWLQGDGIEVGALNHPLWVPDTARVRYVDRLTLEEQRRHYPELAGARLTPVDLVGDAVNLACIDDESVDFVIANHLVEHVEDPIATLLTFERVLKPGGVAYLAIPEQRSTFDRTRELTTVEHLLREHDEGTDTTRREHYVDWARNVMRNENDPETHAERLMAEEYSIHFHCWQADTFLDFFVAARQKVGLDFEIVVFAPPERPDDSEFILILAKGRFGPVRIPPPLPEAPLSLRDRLARTPLGPPVRMMKRALRARRRS